MSDSGFICLDKKYSTTRLIIHEKPIIESQAGNIFRTELFLPEGEKRNYEGGLRSQGYFKQSHVDNPLVTIITVVFNGVQYLEETIQSVINQTYDNVEYIIIDGGSTDGTLDIIRKYEHAIDYWVSERDTGVYNAMNKAIDASCGDWLYFIGSDDYMYNNESIAEVPFVLSDKYLAISGSVVYEDERKVMSSFSKKTLLHNTLHHQGTFYKKKLFFSFRYDEKFKIVADYELNLMLFLRHKKEVKFIENIICFCRLDGLSLKNAKEAHAEMNKVRGKYFGFFENLLLGVLLQCKVILHGILKK